MVTETEQKLHEQIDALDATIRHLHTTIDKLLDHCGDPECYECGAIICPWHEPLHFHHDGCPACCQHEDDV